MNATILLLSGLISVSIMALATYLRFVGNNILIGSIITFVGIFLVLSGLWSQIAHMFKVKEGLTPMKPGDYSSTGTDLLLQSWYPAKEPFHLSELTYRGQSKDYPIFPANSNKTNLIQHWPNPSNGTCSRPDLCNAFYKNIKADKNMNVTPPSWGSGLRVNFYDTCVKQ